MYRSNISKTLANTKIATSRAGKLYNALKDIARLEILRRNKSTDVNSYHDI